MTGLRSGGVTTLLHSKKFSSRELRGRVGEKRSGFEILTSLLDLVALLEEVDPITLMSSFLCISAS